VDKDELAAQVIDETILLVIPSVALHHIAVLAAKSFLPLVLVCRFPLILGRPPKTGGDEEKS
jgi:hypothetical protein